MGEYRLRGIDLQRCGQQKMNLNSSSSQIYASDFQSGSYRLPVGVVETQEAAGGDLGLESDKSNWESLNNFSSLNGLKK